MPDSAQSKPDIQLRAVEGTVWLTQAQMAALSDTSVSNINQHIRAIRLDGEAGEATIKDFSIVRFEGGREVRRTVAHYNLDMILAVGYRVRSERGAQFRRWATTVLREYLVKGFAMDDARLAQTEQWDYVDIATSRRRLRARCPISYSMQEGRPWRSRWRTSSARPV